MVTNSSPGEAPTVAIIGSARLEPPDPAWRQAYVLGCTLGARGWRVMTGGYGGLMGAAAQGARESGAAVVGLPMRGWPGLTPSPWCTELRWAEDYPERLRHLLAANVVVALAGGVGTLGEAAVVWSALQTEPGAARLVLLGARWRRLREAFAAELVIGPGDLGLAPVAEDVDDVLPLLEQAVTTRPGPRG
ncbi:LOG family protein [Nonomuraea jiangxiensis]|uniref:Predicted Rossmann fold nucleotide-binding protein n=1 Tax=Nonomuraea jiangxiensis TaxID=633440 RepID=A0A1G9PJM5_9ACTN|nr:LOG family protein [Nonomuraea jiangxiensis]SDL98929.1 Predicted Rossmann fold nucleotide-binding protein [Nonomuraea jiangxiensis]